MIKIFNRQLLTSSHPFRITFTNKQTFCGKFSEGDLKKAE